MVRKISYLKQNIQILRFCFKISINQIKSEQKTIYIQLIKPMVMFYNLVVPQKTLLSQLKGWPFYHIKII